MLLNIIIVLYETKSFFGSNEELKKNQHAIKKKQARFSTPPKFR